MICEGQGSQTTTRRDETRTKRNGSEQEQPTAAHLTKDDGRGCSAGEDQDCRMLLWNDRWLQPLRAGVEKTLGRRGNGNTLGSSAEEAHAFSMGSFLWIS